MIYDVEEARQTNLLALSLTDALNWERIIDKSDCRVKLYVTGVEGWHEVDRFNPWISSGGFSKRSAL